MLCKGVPYTEGPECIRTASGTAEASAQQQVLLVALGLPTRASSEDAEHIVLRQAVAGPVRWAAGLNQGGEDVDTATRWGPWSSRSWWRWKSKRERITDSVAKRRVAGKDFGGRRPIITDSQIRNVLRLIDAGESATQVARDLGLSRATLLPPDPRVAPVDHLSFQCDRRVCGPCPRSPRTIGMFLLVCGSFPGTQGASPTYRGLRLLSPSMQPLLEGRE